MVVKRSGVTEPFSQRKIIAGVRRACQGRPVTRTRWPSSAQRVEETDPGHRQRRDAPHEVGLAILGPLRELDEVAYLRFARVYRAFSRSTTSRRRSRRCAPRPKYRSEQYPAAGTQNPEPGLPCPRGKVMTETVETATAAQAAARAGRQAA